MEQSGKWPQQTCTTMFFLTLLGGPEVAKWQMKYRVDWDATDGRSGGAHRTVWEVLMERERCKKRAGKEDQGAVTLVLDLAKGFERVSLPVVWAHISASQGRSCECCRFLRAAQLEGYVAEPLRTITTILPRSKWSFLLLRIVLQDASSEVTQIYLPLKY